MYELLIERFHRFFFLKVYGVPPEFALEVTNFISVKYKTELFRSLHLLLGCKRSTFFTFIHRRYMIRTAFLFLK